MVGAWLLTSEIDTSWYSTVLTDASVFWQKNTFLLVRRGWLTAFCRFLSFLSSKSLDYPSNESCDVLYSQSGFQCRWLDANDVTRPPKRSRERWQDQTAGTNAHAISASTNVSKFRVGVHARRQPIFAFRKIFLQFLLHRVAEMLSFSTTPHTCQTDAIKALRYTVIHCHHDKDR